MDDNFKVTKPDSLTQLKKQFELLLATTPENKKSFIELQFTAYVRLFQRYLEESGSSIEWNQIENLPDSSVNTWILNTLKMCLISSLTLIYTLVNNFILN